ncbi:MAG: hypothetical protein V7771_18750 [Shewanella psychromarinicola]|uniref:hypothetical protein n=1 Tax=Shewanella psychromarinicola TaxID=2487742 RepID=UPI003001FAAB
MNKMTSFFYLSLLLPSLSIALESMNDGELGLTTGEGIGVIVENLSIDGKTEGFEMTLDLTEDGSNQLIFSDFSLYKTGTTSGAADSGGKFGTVNDSVSVGDLSTVPIYSGITTDPTDKSYTETTVMRANFPGASIEQLDRSTANQTANSSGYATDLADFNDALYSITDKFDLDLTIDSKFPVPSGDLTKSPGTFNADLEVVGFATYGTYSDIFATVGGGFSMAGATGLYIDSVKLSSNSYAVTEGTVPAVSVSNSSISFNGIDIYTVLGTADQPLTINTLLDDGGTSQIVMEIGALPASKGFAPKSNITVESIFFGEQNNSALQTSASTYAFQPQVGNTLEILGLSIQHLKITTKDL